MNDPTTAARLDATPRWHVGAAALWAATMLPPVAILLLIRALAVNVPFEDDWDMVAVVTRWHAGTLTAADFWQQHSEHRIAALKGLIWAIGATTDFSLTAEMYVGFALSAIKLALLIDLIRRSVDVPPRWVGALIALASSLLMFSLVQHEDWFWGTASLQFGATNLCTVALMWALSRSPDSWRALVVATLCAVVSLFTEASGHVLWITGAAAIWLFSTSQARAVPRLLIWLAVATSVSSIYWWNLQFDASTSTLGLLQSPQRFVVYAGALLGLPFAYWMTVPWAALVGYTALVALVLCAWWLYTSHRERFDTLSPLLLFGLHGALVCGLIAAGRSSGDPNSALTSHYSFAPNLYWVGVLSVTAVACPTWLATATARERRIALSLAGTIGLLLAAGFVRGNVVGYQKAYTRSRNLQMALVRLSSPMEIPRPVLRFLYPPDEERARSLVTQLRTLKLGPFTSGTQAEADVLAVRFTATAAADADGFLDGGDCLAATGWAWDPARPDSPLALDVWSGDVLLGTVDADWFRWDLSAAGKGNGQHAFRFLFPTQGTLRTGRQVRVTFAGTNRGLRGSPTTVFCRD